MHLVISTHISLFWVVCYPSKIFPQKSLSENPRIGSPLLPITKPHPLIPLTHGPPFLYWLGTSWWCLSLMRAPFPCVSMACLLLMCFPWPEGLSVHFVARSWPLMVWMGLWAFVLYISLPSWAGPCLIVGFSFSNPFFAPFVGLLALLPRHSVIPTVLLFNLCLLGLFWACCKLSLYFNSNGLVLSLG